MTDLSGESVEGRLAAHRELLALVLARLAEAPDENDIWRILEERLFAGENETGSSEKGAPSPAHGMRSAAAEELRRVGSEARAFLAARSAHVGAGTP